MIADDDGIACWGITFRMPLELEPELEVQQ